MSYLALYRKWRPSDFDEVKGQDAIVRTLRNQIIYDRIGHAYLFCGTRGTGKTSIAKLFAKAVNCQNPDHGNPCGICPSCQAIAGQNSLDVIEIDAASNNGVDNIRELRDQVQYMPVNGRYKVFIIDEVHMLSAGAFNALLKTLEEPPSYIIFILATTEKHRIPVTILSRCQKYDFRRISVSTIQEHLTDIMAKEGIDAEPAALTYISRAADGSMRDALSLLDQCISFYLGETLTREKVINVLGATEYEVFSRLFRALTSSDTSQVLDIIDQIIWEGRELSQFLNDFLWYLRNLLLFKDLPEDSDASRLNLDMSAEALQGLKEEASMISSSTLVFYIRTLSELSGQLRYSSQKRVLLEVGFIKLCRPDMDDSPEALSVRIEHLEETAAKGFPVSAAAPVSENAGSPGQKPGGTADSAVNHSEDKAKDPVREIENRFSPAEAEDLLQIAREWKKIVSTIDNPMRRHLRQARVMVADDSSRLQLIFEESNLLSENAKAYFERNNQENLEILSGIVAKRTGKRVSFQCVMVSDPVREQDDHKIDLSKIHMEVTIV